MEDLIYDAYSIFYQLLVLAAPERVNDFEFILVCYISGCLFLLLIVWSLCRLCASLGQAVVKMFLRG